MKNHPKSLLACSLAVMWILSRLASGVDAYFQSILIDVGINITLAVSLNLITGFTGQFSLGHAGLMAVGGYTSGAITTIWGPGLLRCIGASPDGAGATALFLTALLIGGLMAGMAGLLVGGPSLRLRGDYLAIVTLGFGEIIRVVFQNMEAVGGARGLAGIPPYTTLCITYAVAILTIYLVTCVVHSTYGRGFLAVRDDEIAAEAMGINTTKYKVTAFVMGAFFAGVAGGLFGHYKQYISPEGFNFMKSVEIVVMVILGGMGNTTGVILAAIVLTLLPEVLRPVAEYRMIMYSLLLVVLMLVCPQGLFVAIGRAGRHWLGWMRRRSIS